ncbi:MAG: N-6 DNA methylase [Bacilli bacterium]|nr:N-6 DNA methylase [Bacilli bacterium]
MELDKNYIKNNIISLGRKYDTRQVFEDFVICCAYSLANAASYNQERENEYLRIAKKYEKEEFNSFAKMFAALQIELGKEDFDDVLGNLYEDLGLSSKHLGQFFTPIHVSDLMAKITFGAEDIKKEIEKDGYTSMSDPCCGSGRMLLSYLKACRENDINMDKVYFEGADLSKLCCCMTYVNLSLLGASAIVYNQDTLLLDVYDSYITPALVYNNNLTEKLVEKGVLKRKDDNKKPEGELANEQ